MISYKVFSEFDFSKPISIYHDKRDVDLVIKFMKDYGHSIDKLYVHFCEGDSVIEEYPAGYFISPEFQFPKFISDAVIDEMFEVLPQRVVEASFGDGADKDIICDGGSFTGMVNMSHHELFEYYCDYMGLYDMSDVENDEIAKKCQLAYDNYNADKTLAKEIKND